MHIAPHVLWLKMKYWQWRNGAPAPEDKVDMLLLRYGTEHKRVYGNIDRIDRDDFTTKEEFFQALARRQIATQHHFSKFIKGLKRTATTTESKAVLAEVYWALGACVSSWDYTLDGVQERRRYRTPAYLEEIRLMRIDSGIASWYEHLQSWHYKSKNKAA